MTGALRAGFCTGYPQAGRNRIGHELNVTQVR
jgi:hypothetical protein